MAKWAAASTQRKSELVKQFRENLATVSECYSAYEQADAVSVKHVDEAFSGIARLGLTQRRIIDRPETQISIGAALIGFAFALPDIVQTIYVGRQPAGLQSGALVTCFCVGCVFFGIGQYRSKMPSANNKPITPRVVVRRIAIGVAFLLLISAAVYSTIRFSESCCNAPTDAPPIKLPSPDPISN